MNFESHIVGDSMDEADPQFVTRRRRIVVAAIVLLILIGAGIFYLNRNADAPDASGEGPGPVVTVIRPKLAPVDLTVGGTGTLAARREMPVGAVGEGGMVQAVLVEPGQWVANGQVLARIERSVQSQQAESLAASISVAQADARLAQSELERARALVSRGFISKADIDRKTATRDVALSRVRVAQAQLREQQARNGRLDIRAPAAGLVLTRSVEPGQIVGASSGVLFRVARGGEMEMLARLGESDIARVHLGASAKVTPTGSTRSFAGQVWQVAPVIEQSSRQGTVRIALRYDPQIRPGGFANASIVTGSGQMPVLPESAIQNDDTGSFVLIVNDANRIERRNVKIGQVGEGGVSIQSGLNERDRIVSLAGGFLNTGQKVRPQLSGTAR